MHRCFVPVMQTDNCINIISGIYRAICFQICFLIRILIKISCCNGIDGFGFISIRRIQNNTVCLGTTYIRVTGSCCCSCCNFLPVFVHCTGRRYTGVIRSILKNASVQLIFKTVCTVKFTCIKPFGKTLHITADIRQLLLTQRRTAARSLGAV